MRISTKGRYGLKAMVYIANNSNENCVSLKSISLKEGISENYLEQIIAQLRKHKLLESVRGAYGGYRLAKDASSISVGDILRALEGSLSPVDCVDETSTKECTCGSQCGDDCVTKEVWQKIDRSITDTVDAISLESLVSKTK